MSFIMYYAMVCRDFFKFPGGIIPSSIYLIILILYHVPFTTMALKSLNVSNACDFVFEKAWPWPWPLTF